MKEIKVLPNLIYRFTAIPIRISASYFVDMVSRVYTKGARPRMASRVLKEGRPEAHTARLPDFL